MTERERRGKQTAEANRLCAVLLDHRWRVTLTNHWNSRGCLDHHGAAGHVKGKLLKEHLKRRRELQDHQQDNEHRVRPRAVP